MPYPKIPDPNIIDIAAWHQVISVVNQVTDTVSALTNDFGVAYDPVFYNNTSGEYMVQYDNSSQKIIYGVTKLSSANSSTSGTYYENVAFTSEFAQRPVITATVFSGNQSGTLTESPDTIVSVYSVDNSGFNIKLRRQDGEPLTSQGVFVNWIAIGPR